MFGSEKAPFEIKQFGRGVAVKCGSDYIGLRSDRTLGAQVFNTILLYYKILLLLYIVCPVQVYFFASPPSSFRPTLA